MAECLIWGLSGLAAGLLVAVAAGWYARRARRRYDGEVERLAFHDALTDLPNRLLFFDRAAVAFAQARRASGSVAIVFLDLDRFKLVNDSLGHAAGDEVLRTVARRLRDHLREGDTVARFGGDEFTMVMPLRHSADVVKVASKLLDVLHMPLSIGSREVAVTASLGISTYPDDDGGDPQTLLRNADAAMYRAKQAGGDNFQLYTREMNAHAFEQLELESRLRRAVSNEEFVLHYQPRVDLAQRRVVAFEALLRWLDPDLGLVLPRDFIQTAEASGLIFPIGDWVFRAACQQARRWHDDGCHDLFVSVNVSARQFHRPGLARAVMEALTAAGLEPRYLELEIDETSVMTNADASMHILRELKSVGVRVLISAFGAGYSSISYLRAFPIDGLKLDRSFSGADKRSLATAALGMAKALNLKVIGEGVETQETAEFLQSLSCDDMQGYLVSAPIPAQECRQFMN
ncbi:MAG TPA: EAL domain-containing protein [Thermoanaerobaculia bacterium]|nr:EAL domain-containing protein [Thermoanaerobaculia bacterium]